MNRPAIVIAVAFAVVFGLFIALVLAHVVVVPYLSPVHIDFQGVNDRYPVNGSIDYSISLKGYGSNCIAFEQQVLQEDKSLAKGEERVAYFNQIQDCRKIHISYAPYNYTRSFSYSGSTVLGKPGDYKIQVHIFDQITRQNLTDTHSFIVVENSSLI